MIKIFEKLQISKLKEGLQKTKQNMFGKVQEILRISPSLTDEQISEIEESLLLSDVGYETTKYIIEEAKNKYKKGAFKNSDDFLICIKDVLKHILNVQDSKESDIFFKLPQSLKPYTIVIAGVNGVGKTTTIGKLAKLFIEENYKILVAAADTFRAAANEQLDIWAKRTNAKIVKHEKGSDPGAVIFDSLAVAEKEKIDIVIIDTAGRLHVKSDLMNELAKIQNVVLKKLKRGPDEVFLVIDAGTGQNAIRQVEEFNKFLKITGIILTKLDGTAKGGIIFQICHRFKIPIRFIGFGEKLDNIQLFNSEDFIQALFEN